MASSVGKLTGRVGDARTQPEVEEFGDQEKQDEGDDDDDADEEKVKSWHGVGSGE
jgi:hypothetical protein